MKKDYSQRIKAPSLSSMSIVERYLTKNRKYYLNGHAK